VSKTSANLRLSLLGPLFVHCFSYVRIQMNVLAVTCELKGGAGGKNQTRALLCQSHVPKKTPEPGVGGKKVDMTSWRTAPFVLGQTTEWRKSLVQLSPAFPALGKRWAAAATGSYPARSASLSSCLLASRAGGGGARRLTPAGGVTRGSQSRALVCLRPNTRATDARSRCASPGFSSGVL
jgi:hypothetical protein